ncbi:MAG: 50S ribosomal protein L15 [Deltaproteobacteria bacterium]|nr:50S ribosomal protein L15 [Deltaproteobacteria bacterium]
MGTKLSDLKPNPGATRAKKRIGRGQGSGTGQTAGKGVKGQKARTGHHGARIGFEGGQMPMQRRLPKRGFKNFFRKDFFAINVGALCKRFPDGVIDVDSMKGAGMVPRNAPRVKVLGEGDVTKKITVRAHAFSEAAKAKLEQAGGVAEVVK